MNNAIRKILLNIFILIFIILFLLCNISNADNIHASTPNNIISDTLENDKKQIMPRFSLKNTLVDIVDSIILNTQFVEIDTDPLELPVINELDSNNLTEPEIISNIIHECNFEIKNTIDATCISEGCIEYTCNCGNSYLEYISIIPHDYYLTDSKPATIVLNGNNTYICSMCSNIYEETISMLTCIADIDMCGDSLIERPLQHGFNPNVMKDLFDAYNTLEIDEETYDYFLPVELKDFKQAMLNEYRYFYDSFGRYCLVENDGAHFKMWKRITTTTLQYDAYDIAKEILVELGIDNTVTQKEAIIRINDWLCQNKSYDYDMYNSKKEKQASTYYSLVNSDAICHNYAIAFQVLCLSAGIECHYVKSNVMNHAWNKIYFSDDSCYWFDTCWNDILSFGSNYSGDELKRMESKYMFMTYNEITQDHLFD